MSYFEDVQDGLISEDGEALVGCPEDCDGCCCHISPPCNHCVEHIGEH